MGNWSGAIRQWSGYGGIGGTEGAPSQWSGYVGIDGTEGAAMRPTKISENLEMEGREGGRETPIPADVVVAPC